MFVKNWSRLIALLAATTVACASVMLIYLKWEQERLVEYENRISSEAGRGGSREGFS